MSGLQTKGGHRAGQNSAENALNRTPLICRQKGDTKRVEMTVFDRLKTDIVHPANRSFLEVEFNFTTIKM